MTTKAFEPIPFGPHSILALLGTGAAGSVYRARQGGVMGFRRTVALKRLHAAADPAQLEALADEARVGALFRHPNVVSVYDFGVVRNDHFYIAMEYVDGWSLEKILEMCNKHKLPMPLGIALKFAIHVAAGLHYLHTLTDREGKPLHLVHRDLKPGNILVDRREGVARITDFGIARHRMRQALTRDGFTKGTPSYMSPEQVMGDETLDHRSDLFALGSIFYELLSTNRAFAEDDSLRTLWSVLEGADEGKIAEVAAIHPMAGQILERLWKKSPEERYMSAQELVLDLQELLRAVDNGTTSEDWTAKIRRVLPPERPDGFFAGCRPVPIEESVDEIHIMFVRPISDKAPLPVEEDEWDVPAPAPGMGGLRQGERPAIGEVFEEPRTVTIWARPMVVKPRSPKESAAGRTIRHVLLMISPLVVTGLVIMVGLFLWEEESVEIAAHVSSPPDLSVELPSIMMEPGEPKTAPTVLPSLVAEKTTTNKVVSTTFPTEPVVPSEPALATLDLYTSPPAEVVLSGKVLGTTPLEVEVPSGAYTLTLRCQVCATQDHALAVNVEPGGVFKKVLRLEEQQY